MHLQREDLSLRGASRQSRARGYSGSRDCAIDSADTRAYAWRQCNDSRRDARGAAEGDSTAAPATRAQVFGTGAGRVYAWRAVEFGGPADDGARLHIRRRPRRHHDDVVDSESRRLPSLRLGRVVFAGDQMGRGAQRGGFHTNPESLRPPLLARTDATERSSVDSRIAMCSPSPRARSSSHDAGSNGLKCPRCVTTASVPRENSVSSAEAARLDRTHQHGNALALAIARFRRSTLTRSWRKIPAGFSPAKNRTWLSRLW